MAVLQLDPIDARRHEFALLFGELDKLAGSEHDPATWVQRAAQNRPALPRLFLTVGRQEDVYPLSGYFHATCQSLGIQSDYHEDDGQHDWFQWDQRISQFLLSVLGPIPTK